MFRKSVFFSLLGVSTTVAAFCCDPWGLPVREAFIQAGQVVARSITASASAIAVPTAQIQGAIQDGTTRVAGMRQQQTAAQHTMADGRMAVQQQAEQQRAAAEAVEQRQPAPQMETTVTDAALTAELDPIVSDKVVAYDEDWSNHFLSKTPQDVTSAILARHQPYCAPEDVARGVCPQAAIPALQNADLTVNSLYQPGNGQYNTLSDQEHAAAIAFVQNLTQPAPYAPPATTNPTSTQGAAGALANALTSDQAALALVAHSFNTQIAERTRRHE